MPGPSVREVSRDRCTFSRAAILNQLPRKRQSPSRPSEGCEGPDAIATGRSSGRRWRAAQETSRELVDSCRTVRPLLPAAEPPADGQAAITPAQARTVAGSGAGTWSIGPPVGE